MTCAPFPSADTLAATSPAADVRHAADADCGHAGRSAHAFSPQGGQAVWHFSRDNGSHDHDEAWPRPVRLAIIGALALASWALALGACRLLWSALT